LKSGDQTIRALIIKLLFFDSLNFPNKKFDTEDEAIQHSIKYGEWMAVVLGKSEYPREPITGISHVAVYEMRKHRSSWHGTVIHSHSIL
jgi:hypothetical protein